METANGGWLRPHVGGEMGGFVIFTRYIPFGIDLQKLFSVKNQKTDIFEILTNEMLRINILPT